MQFRHGRAADVHAPGFYLHLEPDAVFAACGPVAPGPTEWGRVRDAIVARSRTSGGARSPRPPRPGPSGGERLVRAPRGYDPDHPFVDDLKRKDFLVTAAFAEAEACRPDFLARYARTCRAAAPFVRFLTEAVGLPW